MELNVCGRITGAKLDFYKSIEQHHNTLYLLFDDFEWPYGYISFTNVDPAVARGIVHAIETAHGRKPEAAISNVGGPEPTEQLLRDDEL